LPIPVFHNAVLRSPTRPSTGSEGLVTKIRAPTAGSFHSAL